MEGQKTVLQSFIDFNDAVHELKLAVIASGFGRFIRRILDNLVK